MACTPSERHCAFCLKAGKVSLCSGCHRRAYCSKLCQTNDWAPGKGGQGHKLWCSRFCGEEDMDWEVRAAADGAKGLGVFALRDLPRFTRIIVDGMRSEEDPGIMDLMPVDGSRDDKIKLNAFTVYLQGVERDALYLRFARLNHSCSPNCYSTPDVTAQATIVMTDRAVAAGEELTVCYRSFNEPMRFMTQQAVRAYLTERHGVVCTDDCICTNRTIYQLSYKASLMFTKLTEYWDADRAEEVDAAMALTEALLPLLGQIQATYHTRYTILYATSRLVLQYPADGRHLQRVGEFVEEVSTATSAIHRPDGILAQTAVVLQATYKSVMAKLRLSPAVL